MNTDDLTSDKAERQSIDSMDLAVIQAVVKKALSRVAPDIELDEGDTGANLFDEFDIDSIDFVNLITRLSERFGVLMPERDYSQMQSVEALAAYLQSSLESSNSLSSNQGAST